MYIPKIIKFFIILLLIIPFIVAVDYMQIAELKEDGSGTMKVNYWTRTSNIKDEMAGGLPFSKVKIEAAFSSDNNVVNNITIKPAPSDTTYIGFDVSFKDITKLSSAKAFSNLNPSWTKEEDGTINFLCLVGPQPDAGNAVNYYIFTFPGEVVKTNGSKKGNRVTFNKKGNDTMTAHINPKGKVDTGKDTSTKTEEKKSCGLFGVELPIIIFLGLFLTYSLRGKKTS